MNISKFSLLEVCKRYFFLLLIIFFGKICYAQQKSLGELMIHSTSKIECIYQNDSGEQYEGSGTGFFFNFHIDDKVVPCLVTNRHVVDNSIAGRIRFTVMKSDSTPDYGVTEEIIIRNFRNQWFNHPDNSIDLCIMPIAPIINQIQAKGVNLFYVPISEDIIPSDSIWSDFEVLEEVTMIGYPNGVYDNVNNVPMLRVGQTATPLKLDYQGRKEFMMNITSIPGSSGSPVYLYNEGTYKSGSSIIFGTRIYFLGILYAGPARSTIGSGEIMIDKVPVTFQTSTSIPIGLGMCIKSTEILGFINIIEELIKE